MDSEGDADNMQAGNLDDNTTRVEAKGLLK